MNMGYLSIFLGIPLFFSAIFCGVLCGILTHLFLGYGQLLDIFNITPISIDLFLWI